MRNPMLPRTIDRFDVRDDGVLCLQGQTQFPWIREDGFLGGTVRYRLVAEEVSLRKTQETQ